MPNPSIVDVQGIPFTGGSSGPLTASPALVPGDLIVCFQTQFNGSVGTTPTDNRSNTYTRIGTIVRGTTSGLGGLDVWMSTNAFSGTVSVTLNPTGSRNAGSVWFLRDCVYNNDRVSKQATTNAVDAGPISPPANSILLAFATIPSGVNLSEASGWNLTGVNGFTSGMSTRAKPSNWNGGQNDLFSQYLIAPGGSVTPSWPTSGAGDNWVAMALSFGSPSPTPTSVTPNVGATAGGTPVTITGSNFIAPLTVTFDGVPATNVIIVSPTSVTCVAPAHAVGNAVITTTNPGGSGSLLASQFTYAVQPQPTSVMPQFATTGGAVALTIRGAGFLNGATVTIGGTPATSVVVVDQNTITCVAPAHAAGNAVITVTNP